MQFHFDSYKVDGTQVVFTYSHRKNDVVVQTYSERIIMPTSLQTQGTIVSFILQQLHIAIGMSYYKCLPSPVELPYKLTQEESDYWNTVYENGLAEFVYTNSLPEFIKPFTYEKSNLNAGTPLSTQGAILGIGGGKDSIVGGELLKKLAVPVDGFHVASGSHSGQAADVANKMKIELRNIERYVDVKAIKKFNAEHNGLNGHIPISVIFAWLGILLAYVSKKAYVVVGNEAATNVGNVVYLSKQINHQWSKSLEFEKITQSFVHNYISPDITYFSVIRPFSSIKIMQLMQKLGPQYLYNFTSCNLVLRIDQDERPNGRWCGKCAKCLSTYLLLSIWLDQNTLQQIFSKNMLDDATLGQILRELLGIENHKPLDCVGTQDELRYAARQLLKKEFNAPLLKFIQTENIPGSGYKELVGAFNSHSMPEKIALNLQKIA